MLKGVGLAATAFVTAPAFNRGRFRLFANYTDRIFVQGNRSDRANDCDRHAQRVDARLQQTS